MSKVSYAVLDTETGGKYASKHGLCSIGIVAPDGDTFHTIIKPVPGRVYDEEALAVNGFTLETLERDGVPEKVAMEDAVAFLLIKCPDAFIAGVNIQFDMDFFSAAIRRVQGDAADDFFKRVHKRTYEIQTLAITAHEAGIITLPDDPKRPGVPQTNLDSILSSIGLSRDGEKHDVVEDCLKTREALFTIKGRLQALSSPDKDDKAPLPELTMEGALAGYRSADEALTAAEKNLNRFCNEEMKTRTTVEALQELTEILPRSYPGTRRIYERILRLDETPPLAAGGHAPAPSAESRSQHL